MADSAQPKEQLHRRGSHLLTWNVRGWHRDLVTTIGNLKRLGVMVAALQEMHVGSGDPRVVIPGFVVYHSDRLKGGGYQGSTLAVHESFPSHTLDTLGRALVGAKVQVPGSEKPFEIYSAYFPSRGEKRSDRQEQVSKLRKLIRSRV